MALTRGADHTREDLLGPCAAGRPIPATDLAIDDGGADGVFSAPVGRVDVGGPQEGEHSRELAVEMPGEALGRRQSGRRVDEPAQAGKQAPAGPSEALLGDRVGIPPIAEREGVGEDGLHAGCPRAPRMVGTERATPAEQMCQAALVQRAGEAAIGRPSVADQHTGEVRAQDRDRIVKATPGADRIHGGLRCRERPQPVQYGTDAPAGFIRTDDGTPPDLSAESRVRGRRYPGRAMQDLSKSSRRDRQPEPVLQQCCDLLQRHAHVFVQQDRKRHGARTELYACRAQGVGGLQRVPALHAVPACDAAPDLNVEPPHDWLDDGQVFLVLGRDASGLNRPTTARARHGKRRGIRLIHPRRNRSPAATSIGGTCPPARSPAATLRAVLRKRGGLSKARAPRRVELLFETLASSLPSIAIACRAGQLLTQAGNLILVALDQLVAFVARRSRALVDHACVMSYPRKLYKPNSLDLLPSPAKQRRLIEGIRLHRALPGSTLVLSGGAVFDPVPGAEAMAKMAQLLGVDTTALLLESASRDTAEHARLLQPVIGRDSFVLVTSAYHMLRAVPLFEKRGMNPLPAPTAHRILGSHGFHPSNLFPGVGGFSTARLVMHEYVGLAWAKVRGDI